MIHLVFGPQGAGKSTLARTLASQHRAVRFSIDDWMAGLYGPDLPQPLNLPWILERVQRCEQRIWAVAADLVRSGGTAVLDLGCMQAADRARFAALASAQGLALQGHFVTAPLALRRQRVLARSDARGETFAFAVSPAMFDRMELRFEPPDAAELQRCVQVQTG
ncbi:MAG: ATP-binding protein [Pseudomonadota bacterium]